MPSFFKTKKIKPPKSLGETLCHQRKKMALSLRQIEKETKIKKAYLLAIESNNWNELPSKVYVAGFLQTYAKTLHLDPKTILNNFQKEHQAQQNFQKKILKSRREIKVNKVYLTPRMFIIGLIILITLSLAGYLWFQISGFASAPLLTISEPQNAEVRTQTDKIKISGTTEADANIMINKEPIAVNTSGQFEQEVNLFKGINIIEVVSTNNVGKSTTKVLQVMAE